jgi:hypothetical protein
MSLLLTAGYSVFGNWSRLENEMVFGIWYLELLTSSRPKDETNFLLLTSSRPKDETNFLLLISKKWFSK